VVNDDSCDFAPLMFSKSKVSLHVMKADAGGSGMQIARGLNTLQSGGEQIQLKVPNNKVGHSDLNL
jgi:hypothetical protein